MVELWTKGPNCDVYSNVNVTARAYRVADILVMNIRYGLNARIVAFRIDGNHVVVDCIVTPRPEEYIVALRSYVEQNNMYVVHI